MILFHKEFTSAVRGVILDNDDVGNPVVKMFLWTNWVLLVFALKKSFFCWKFAVERIKYPFNCNEKEIGWDRWLHFSVIRTQI